MAKKKINLISPLVNIYETDLSDYQSTQKGASLLPASTTSSGDGGGSNSSNNNNNNNDTDFILCEDFAKLLQEDGNKLIQ